MSFVLVPRAVLLCLVSLLILPCRALADSAPGNLVQSPNPLLSNGTAAPGWTLTGNVQAKAEPEYIREGMASVTQVQTRGAKLSQTISAAPKSELLVTAEVRSDGRLIGYAGNVPMAYHKQGQWQTLAGFARVEDSGKLEISFLSDSLNGKGSARLEIRNVSARPLVRPEKLERLAASGETPLVSGGKPEATIVYPAAGSFRAAAEQISARIGKITGTAVPILSDVEATAADAPKLRDDLRGRNLILIGRLGTNRALWTAYNHWLDATDGYYPGGDGYVVRTAADVLHNGKNHLILGGSSEKGVGRAVEKFLSILDGAKGGRGELRLPFLLDVELGGECLEAFKKHDGLWSHPDDRALPPVEPGYGTIRRWYENAMGWYWSGWDSYRQRAAQTLEPVLKDQAYTHHYITEFLVRTYDMVDETGLMSEDQRQLMEKLILSNFLDFLTEAGDGSWMTTFSPPYENIEIVNRHQISPWMSDLTLASFLAHRYKLPADLAALAQFRESEKGQFLKHVLSERWDSSLPGGAAEVPEELSNVLMRRALETEQYEFFNRGLARRMLAVEKLDPLLGSWVRPGGAADTRHILTTLASYYRDGRYLWLSRHFPSGGVSFMNRTLNGVHRYVPGPELAEQDPSDLAGVQVPEMMPHRQRQLAGLSANAFGKIKFDPKTVFDFASFRSGFGKEDDYVAINGLVGQGIPGTFVRFMSRGAEWLPLAGTESYFDHNAVYVLRTDRWPEEKAPFSAAAQLVWKSGLGRSGGTAFALDPHAGTRWERAFVWVRPGLFIVRDRVMPKESGEYQVMINWRPAGAAAWEGNSWVAATAAGKLRLTPLSQDFAISENASSAQDETSGPRRLRLLASRKLGRGEPLTAIAVLNAYADEAGAKLRARALGDNGVLLFDGSSKSPEAAVLFGSNETIGLKTDARCVVIGRDQLKMMAGSSVELGGKPLLRCDAPASISIDAGTGDLLADSAQQAAKRTLQVGEKQVALEKGAGQAHIDPAGGLAEAMGQALDRAAAAAPAEAPKAGGGKGPQITIADHTGQWKQGWKYEGLRRPTPAAAAHFLAGGIVDLGRDTLIAEIKPRDVDGKWRIRRLPADLRYAAAGPDGSAPAENSPLWKAFEQKPEMVAGVMTGNYGQSVPVAESHERLRPRGVRARYLRSAEITSVTVYDGEALGREVPLSVRLADLDGDGREEIVAYSRTWPKFVRPLSNEFDTDALAVLSADGTERFQQEYGARLQAVKPLPLGGKVPSLTVATQDGMIRVLKPDGQAARQIDLYQLHQQFHKSYGRENTRHPAGGFVMPFSLGVWRPTGSEPGLAVARYHSFSFIGPDDKLEGVLMQGGYVQPAMLAEGIDFKGDGRQEQLCLGRGVLFRLHGPLDQRVEEPNGYLFYPQVYHIERLDEPAWEERIDGSRPFIFQAVRLGVGKDGRPKYVASVRENYCGIYEAAGNRWAFAWVPLVAMRCATIVDDGPERLKLAAVTEDGMLWQLEFSADLSRPSRFAVSPLPMEVNDIAAIGVKSAGQERGGRLLLAGPRGLYLVGGDRAIEQIAAGSFVEAQPGAGGIVAAGQDGSVVRLEASGDGAGKP